MRLLFIAHTHGIYGASRSLQQITRNCPVPFDIVFPREPGNRVSIDDLKEFYGLKKENRIIFFHLPFEYSYSGSPTEKIYRLKNHIRSLLWRLNSNSFYKFLRSEKYDIIHLNSLTLNPVISLNHTFTVHIREVLKSPKRNTITKLKQAKALIFIDKGTQESICTYFSPKNSIILNNPFDMSVLKSERYDRDKICNELGLSYNDIVFSLIGRISPVKGVDFIINCFKATPSCNKKLLIVGAGDKNTPYEEKCRTLAADDNRIIFKGEEPDINRIYSVSDYIVRGEDQHLIGRTVFEGLFAGCKVIIPGENNDISLNRELTKWQQNVLFYSPRNSKELTGVLETAGTKSLPVSFHSNQQNYLKTFLNFLERSRNHDI